MAFWGSLSGKEENNPHFYKEKRKAPDATGQSVHLCSWQDFGADPHGHKAKAHGKKGVTGHSQNGLTKVKSRLTNLVVLYNRVRALMDKGRAMAFIYLDLHKAYDTVPHDMLVSKLKKA